MRLAMPGPWKHPKTGAYYLRQRVPADLTKIARGKLIAIPVDGTPKTVRVGEGVKVSLGTKDPGTAKQRFRDADAALQRQWEALRSGPASLSQKETQALAGLAYRAFIDAFDNNPGSPERWRGILRSNAEAGAGVGSLNILGSLDEQQAETMDQRFGGIVDGIVRARGLVIDAPSRQRLIVATMDALNKSAATNLKKAQGDYSPDPYSESFPALQSREQKAGFTISALFDLWKKEHAQTHGAASTVKRWRPVVNSLKEHLGHDDANGVSLKDTLEWKDKLISSGVVSVATFKKVHRAAMSTIFRVGIANLKVTDNPFRELRVKSPKKRKERMQGFSDEEAKAILRAALAAGKSKRAGDKMKNARRWAPWLCAYSGARIGEIAQLRKESVRPVEGIPCYWITPEDGDVKDKEPRFVPIHPHLIEQGFLEFVEEAPSGPLFYGEKTGAHNPAAGLRRWVRSAARVKDPRVQPNHAWRHTFKNIASLAGIAPMYADMICGHELRTEGEKYSDRLAPVLDREMRKFPRFNV